jgi:Protein of unknown function (DUF3105)
VSSRQQEKERRRQERIAREQAEKRAAARRKRLQMVGGVLLGVAAVVGVVIAIVATGGGDEGGANEPSSSEEPLPKLPQQQTADLDAAAKAAGCRVIHARNEGAQHEEREFTASDYRTNPPTSGTHFPQWAQDGIYEEGEVPPLGELVHTLEHGRIDVQYKPGTPERIVNQLKAFLAENNDGYHMLLYPNQTGMEYQVAATAWTQLLGCREWNDKAIDALRTFRQRYIDKGPEKVP